MRSNFEWCPEPAPAIAAFAAPAPVRPARPVWVDLDRLFARDSARDQAVFDGLALAGRARGLLLGWHRGSRGDWLGVVNYQIHYADGRPQPTIWTEQLLPAAALSPRTDSVSLG